MNQAAFIKEGTILIRLAVPLAIMKGIVGIRAFIFTIFAAQMGTETLAAMAYATTFLMFTLNIVVGLLLPISVELAQSTYDHAKIHIKLKEGIFYATIISIPIMLLLYNANIIYTFFTTEENITQQTEGYFHAVTWAILPFAYLMVYQQIYLNFHKVMRLLVWVTSGTLLIILMSYCLSFGKFNLPAFGITGFAIGTSIGFWLLLFVVIFDIKLFLPQNPEMTMVEQSDIKKYYQLWQIGWPIAIKYCSYMTLFAIIAILISYYGEAELAAYQILTQCVFIAYLISSALSQAILLRVNQALGQSQNEKAIQTSYLGLVITIVMLFIPSLLILLNPEWIIQLFTTQNTHSSEKIANIVRTLIGLICLFLIFDALRLTFIKILASFNDTFLPLLLQVFSLWIIGFPLGYYLARYAHLQSTGYWEGITLGMILCCFLLFRRMRLQFLKLS